MPTDSLNKLTIDKTKQNSSGGSKRIRARNSIIAAILIAAIVAVVIFSRNRPVVIELTSVSQFFPTQSFTVLNASGYVVAQRKAAVASKTTGRLEWIGVEEGSRVSGGQIIARLENKDLEAVVGQAEAALQNSRANLDQVKS